MKVEIYSKPQCPYCVKAKNLADLESLDYDYYMLDVDFTREQLFEKFPTARTFPQITIDGKSIGGYTEFESHIYVKKELNKHE
jgi:glutaredoxin 3